MSLPFFGRAYSLEVVTTAGDKITLSSSDTEPEALRIVFEIELTVFSALWTAFIRVYNADTSLTQALITQGANVSLSGGYKDGNNGLLFSGLVIDCQFEKENGVDYVLTLQCMVGADFLINNFVTYTQGPFSTQRQQIATMAAKARKPFTVDDPQNVLNGATTGSLPCPKVGFGSPMKFLQEACRQANTFFVANAGGITIVELKAKSATPDLIFSSPIAEGDNVTNPDAAITYSIIGSPQQTQGVSSGVTFKVLLDSRVQIAVPNPMTVKIDNTVIRQLPLPVNASSGQIGIPAFFSQDGVYAVVGIRHLGDSRGNPWWTEIDAIMVNSQTMQLGVPNSDNYNASVGITSAQ
jgi:hypothetical protein